MECSTALGIAWTGYGAGRSYWSAVPVEIKEKSESKGLRGRCHVPIITWTAFPPWCMLFALRRGPSLGSPVFSPCGWVFLYGRAADKMLPDGSDRRESAAYPLILDGFLGRGCKRMSQFAI